MGLCVVGPVGLIGPLSGGLVGLVVQWIWWAVGLVVGPRVWWACGSGGFCGVLTAKSPTLRGPTCQGLLGLVYIVYCFVNIQTWLRISTVHLPPPL